MFKTDPISDKLIHTIDSPVLDYKNHINIKKTKMYLSGINMILQDKNNPKNYGNMILTLENRRFNGKTRYFRNHTTKKNSPNE